MNLAILVYNNYFNRIVKIAGRLAEDYFRVARRYQAFAQSLNLKPNDSIYTTIILNSPEFDSDYLIEYGEDGIVSSRWFVMEMVRKRGGQYELTLRRDVIAENLKELSSADAIIERGPLPEASPFLLNPEGFDFNEIKRGETYLKDESGTAWIVGYIDRGFSNDNDITASSETSSSYPTIESLGLKLNDEADPAKGATLEAVTDAAALCNIAFTSLFWTTGGYAFKASLTGGGLSIFSEIGLNPDYALYERYDPWTDPDGDQKDKAARAAYLAAVNAKAATTMSLILSAFSMVGSSKMDAVMALDGKIVYSSDKDKYYQLGITRQTYESNKLMSVAYGDSLPLFEMLKSFVLAVPEAVQDYEFLDPEKYSVSVDLTVLNIGLSEVAVGGQMKTNISNSRNHLTDAPYDMFAMPFNRDNLALAQAMRITLGTSCYDIQILPYCPFRDYIDDFDGGVEGQDYSAIGVFDDDLGDYVTVGYMLYPLSCSDSFVIYEPIAADAYITASLPEGAARTKVLNETQKFRLCSPNYNSAFDFSVMKNGGKVGQWKIDFTYRPISPYVHVAPMYGGIYGSYNNDARGLILSGDFSIDTISDPWINYQVQNKNYENIFNTQIKTMDQLHDLERLQKALGTTAGSVTAGVAAGVKTGNAFVGLATAGAAAGAGIFDFAMNEERFQISRRQAIELFAYQIGNVKAMPNTLTKVSSYNVNNKYFPLVEVYGCTDEEIKAFSDFLRIRNFRVGIVAKISEFMSYFTKKYEFLKGKLILNEELSGDTHVAEEIYKEIDQGVYFDESATATRK